MGDEFDDDTKDNIAKAAIVVGGGLAVASAGIYVNHLINQSRNNNVPNRPGDYIIPENGLATPLTRDQQLSRIRSLRAGWDQHRSAIEEVRGLEKDTMLVSATQRVRGYYPEEAVQGYQRLVRAYQVLNHDNLTSQQHARLDRFLAIQDGLVADLHASGGYGMPDQRTFSNYIQSKVSQLETPPPHGGEVYMIGGHDHHFNIVRIKKYPDGTYTHTKYDSGHETNVVGYEGNRAVSHALEERQIKPGSNIAGIIGSETIKFRVSSGGAEYKNHKLNIDRSLEKPPIRADEDYAQRRGNCTTRGQRILLNDVLQDQPLASKMREFVTDPNLTHADIAYNLQQRQQSIESGGNGAVIRPGNIIPAHPEGMSYNESGSVSLRFSKNTPQGHIQAFCDKHNLGRFTYTQRENDVKITPRNREAAEKWGLQNLNKEQVRGIDGESYKSRKQELGIREVRIVEPESMSGRGGSGRHFINFEHGTSEEQIRVALRREGLNPEHYDINTARNSSNGFRASVRAKENAPREAIEKLHEYGFNNVHEEHQHGNFGTAHEQRVQPVYARAGSVPEAAPVRQQRQQQQQQQSGPPPWLEQQRQLQEAQQRQQRELQSQQRSSRQPQRSQPGSNETAPKAAAADSPTPQPKTEPSRNDSGKRVAIAEKPVTQPAQESSRSSGVTRETKAPVVGTENTAVSPSTTKTPATSAPVSNNSPTATGTTSIATSQPAQTLPPVAASESAGKTTQSPSSQSSPAAPALQNSAPAPNSPAVPEDYRPQQQRTTNPPTSPTSSPPASEVNSSEPKGNIPQPPPIPNATETHAHSTTTEATHLPASAPIPHSNGRPEHSTTSTLPHAPGGGAAGNVIAGGLTTLKSIVDGDKIDAAGGAAQTTLGYLSETAKTPAGAAKYNIAAGAISSAVAGYGAYEQTIKAQEQDKAKAGKNWDEGAARQEAKDNAVIAATQSGATTSITIAATKAAPTVVKAVVSYAGKRIVGAEAATAAAATLGGATGNAIALATSAPVAIGTAAIVIANEGSKELDARGKEAMEASAAANKTAAEYGREYRAAAAEAAERAKAGFPTLKPKAETSTPEPKGPSISEKAASLGRDAKEVSGATIAGALVAGVPGAAVGAVADAAHKSDKAGEQAMTAMADRQAQIDDMKSKKEVVNKATGETYVDAKGNSVSMDKLVAERRDTRAARLEAQKNGTPPPESRYHTEHTKPEAETKAKSEAEPKAKLGAEVKAKPDNRPLDQKNLDANPEHGKVKIGEFSGIDEVKPPVAKQANAKKPTPATNQDDPAHAALKKAMEEGKFAGLHPDITSDGKHLTEHKGAPHISRHNIGPTAPTVA